MNYCKLKEKMLLFLYWEVILIIVYIIRLQKGGYNMSRPLFKDFISLGEGKGLSITLWKTALKIERKEREKGSWRTTQEITLAPRVLEYIFARIPMWIALMTEKENME